MNNQTSSLEFSHFPVMLNEVLKISSPSTRQKFIDCTFGGGGYSKEILKFLKNINSLNVVEKKKNETFYRKRDQADSVLDINKTIKRDNDLVDNLIDNEALDKEKTNEILHGVSDMKEKDKGLFKQFIHNINKFFK